MNLRQFASTLAAAALLTGALTAGADTNGPRRITRAGDASMIESAGTLQAPRAGLIFSNFDKPTAAFQDGGFVVAGAANMYGFGKQFVAAPFAAKQGSTLTSIAVAVNHELGTSTQLKVLVKLYADAAGIPGALIQSWPAAPVADYLAGNFSYLAVSADSTGIALTAAATYWVAVETDGASDFYGTWNSNNSRGTGPMAYWNDSTAIWVPYTTTVPALAVYGQTR